MSNTRIPLTAWVRQLDSMKIRIETRRGELQTQIYLTPPFASRRRDDLEDRLDHYEYLWHEIDRLAHTLEAARRH